MLKSLLESKFSTNFIIIADTEEVSGQDLFINALRNHIADNSTNKIVFTCYENPPAFYLPTSTDEKKLITYNYFTDPCGWNDSSAPKSDLSPFISHPANFSGTTFFIDSLTHFTNYHGYCTTYKTLSDLKQFTRKVVCLAHSDLFTPVQIEELQFLATAFISLRPKNSDKISSRERIAQVTYRKSGGKVIKQTESFTVNDELKVTSAVSQTKVQVPSSGKEDVQHLTTFKLGLQMSEKERKAKDELVLPYLKSRGGEIMYQPDTDEMEEDPDDDLDI